MSDFSTKVAEAFPNLTPSHKAVAAYMTDHLNTIAFCTLEDLAQGIGVSTTTVLRFARTLGYQGYSDLQKDIQSDMMNKVGLPERFSQNHQSPEDQDQLLVDMVHADIHNLEEILTTLPKENINQAAKAISNANRVYVLGLRSSFTLAYYIYYRLSQTRPNVWLIQSTGLLYPEDLVSCKEGDVCIAYLYPRYSHIAADLLLWMKKRGVTVVLFTAQNYTMLQGYGDIFLPASVSSVSFKNSLAAPLCLSSYLASAVANEDPDRAIKTLQLTEEGLAECKLLGL